MKYVTRYVTIVLLTLTVGACASLSKKQTAVVSLQASETALEASHDAERLLCNPTADQKAAITHCEGSSAESIGLTDARHQAIAKAYSIAFASEIKAASALQAWKAGDPAPSNLAEYQVDLNAILDLVGSTIPQTQTTVVKIKEAITAAASIASIAGVK
jgi:hypothetical protein